MNQYTLINGEYTVLDPTNAARRSYIDPQTNEPYLGGYQPFAKNLAAAMKDKYINGGSYDDRTNLVYVYGDDPNKFLRNFAETIFPHRIRRNKFKNSEDLRIRLRELP